MIFYSVITGDAIDKPVKLRPKHCFIMSAQGDNTSRIVKKILKTIEEILKANGYECVDAMQEVRGTDFLEKIAQMIYGVPIGIAIVDKNYSPQTLSNIYYELGIMDALGKETLIIKTKETDVPSDLVRTEYIEYGKGYNSKIQKFLNGKEIVAEYYEEIALHVDKNPLLAIDYLRRAYLLTGDEKFCEKAKEFHSKDDQIRAKNSVENLLMQFANIDVSEID